MRYSNNEMCYKRHKIRVLQEQQKEVEQLCLIDMEKVSHFTFYLHYKECLEGCLRKEDKVHSNENK